MSSRPTSDKMLCFELAAGFGNQQVRALLIKILSKRTARDPQAAADTMLKAGKTEHLRVSWLRTQQWFGKMLRTQDVLSKNAEARKREFTTAQHSGG